MNTTVQSSMGSRRMSRSRSMTQIDRRQKYRSHVRSRGLLNSRRRREHILACLAFVMLIVAWDATLRLDEHITPPRMRVSHAVEVDADGQVQTFVP